MKKGEKMNKVKIIYMDGEYWYKFIFFCPAKKTFIEVDKNKATGINKVWSYKDHLINDKGLKTILDKTKEKFNLRFILRARLNDKKIKQLIEDGYFTCYMSASWGLMYSTLNISRGKK